METKELLQTEAKQAIKASLNEIKSIIDETAVLSFNASLKDLRFIYEDLKEFLVCNCNADENFSGDFKAITIAFNEAEISNDNILTLIDLLNIWMDDFEKCLAEHELFSGPLDSQKIDALKSWINSRFLN